jgi:4-hydroxyphenylacetate decarboxylase large subunit
MDALSSINNEFPYWYTREYLKHDNEISVVRRAIALKAGFSHLTPAIFPRELLAVRKGSFFRGSFPMPWLTERFFVTQGDALYQESVKRGSASAGEHSKFGGRQEEVPVMIKLAHMWKDKSVEDISNTYEQMVPGYDIKEKIMRSVICMFDSGFTLP